MFAQVDSFGNVFSINSQPQLTQDEVYISNNHPSLVYLLQDVSSVKYIGGDFEYRPKANEYQIWNGVSWVTDQSVLADARLEIWEGIKEYRQLHQTLGVKVKINNTDYWIHSDQPSRELHLGMRNDALCHVLREELNVPSLPLFEPIPWKTMQKQANGEPLFVVVDHVAAIAIYEADKKMTKDCFAKAEYHRVMMQHSTDPLNYNYKTGWPPVFGE